MTRRIIVTSDPEAQQLETQMRLGEVGADTHDKAELMGDTAVGTGGALELYSRGDHVHPVSLASGLNIAAISAATSTGGHTTVFCRADHQHYFDFATQVNEFAGTKCTTGLLEYFHWWNRLRNISCRSSASDIKWY
jgi:hypothetical protein